jgi:hypothetical protein
MSSELRLSDMIKYSFNSMKRTSKDFDSMLLLYALFLSSFLIIPFFVIFGYMINNSRRSIKGEKSIVSLNPYKNLFKQGVVGAVIIPFVLSLGILLPSFLFLLSLLIVGSIFGLIGWIGFGVGLLTYQYVFFAIICSYADHQNIRDFSVISGSTKQLLKSRKYLIVNLIVFVLNFIFIPIMIASSIISLFGIFIIPAVVTLELVFSFRLIGWVYRDLDHKE